MTVTRPSLTPSRGSTVEASPAGKHDVDARADAGSGDGTDAKADTGDGKDEKDEKDKIQTTAKGEEEKGMTRSSPPCP